MPLSGVLTFTRIRPVIRAIQGAMISSSRFSYRTELYFV